jgi:mRNA-degrading endonuclease YafQ of YafQ-DinJ toxin-antitoxin module
MRISSLYKKYYRSAANVRKDKEEEECSEVYKTMQADLVIAFKNGSLAAEWRDYSDNRISYKSIECAMSRLNQEDGVTATKGKKVVTYDFSYTPIVIAYQPTH